MSTATTPTAAEAELAVQAKQVQATSLSMMQTAGWRAIEQRSQENMQKNIDAVVASGDDTF